MNYNTHTNPDTGRAIIGTLAEVLRPRPCAQPRSIRAFTPDRGSAAESVVTNAGEQVRAMYYAGTVTKKLFGDDFAYARADTAMTALEVEEAIACEVEASIAAAVFKEANFFSDVMPMTQRAQVEIQVFVMDVARKCRFLFAQQQVLA